MTRIPCICKHKTAHLLSFTHSNSQPSSTICMFLSCRANLHFSVVVSVAMRCVQSGVSVPTPCGRVYIGRLSVRKVYIGGLSVGPASAAKF